MRRIPSIENLIRNGIVVDKEDGLALRVALMNGRLGEADRIMETGGCVTKDVKGRRGHTYQVDFFLNADEPTLLSIDGRSWFIGDVMVTCGHLERHG